MSGVDAGREVCGEMFKVGEFAPVANGLCCPFGIVATEHHCTAGVYRRVFWGGLDRFFLNDRKIVNSVRNID